MLTHHEKHKAHLQLLSDCNLSPWDCGELLFQCLDVSELDSLSSSSGFNHLTLKKGSKHPSSHSSKGKILHALLRQRNEIFYKTPISASCSATDLDICGLNLSIRGDLLVCQHISVALGQGLLTGGRHLDGVGDDGLQNCPQVHAGGRLVVHPLLPTSRARATVKWSHRGRCLQKR